MTTGEWFVLIPLNQGLFLNSPSKNCSPIWTVLIPLYQGLFLTI